MMKNNEKKGYFLEATLRDVFGIDGVQLWVRW